MRRGIRHPQGEVAVMWMRARTVVVRAVNEQLVGWGSRPSGTHLAYSQSIVKDTDGFNIRIIERPAFWRASTNDLNAWPASSFPEYVSSCSSGNNSRGSSPSSSRRQRESSPTSPSSIRKVFTLLNDLERLYHSARSTSLCSLHE